ncbi:GNAT family N-acetyltransferase [Pseudonocardia sp. CA-107938]|uniref:GNAT family N-acetyltransferase n=1 Tax=Pseudonocardia sp. CA-107938 TaxID=3240021 RepID=UPI003D8FABB9
MTVRLRPSTPSDLTAVLAAETDPTTRQWLGDASIAWHERHRADPAAEHLVAERDGAPVGHVVLVSADGVAELRRIVVWPDARGTGAGRATLIAAADHAFARPGTHRLWLDVKAGNAIARRLYAGAGFVEEGVLREAMLETDGSWSSLVVMSVLDREWAARDLRSTAPRAPGPTADPR